MERTDILLIEDRNEIRQAIMIQLEAVTGSGQAIQVQVITQENVGSLLSADQVSNEVALAEGIRKNFPDVSLIVVDHDLSVLNAPISESSITAAAHTLAIPVCRYHRHPTGTVSHIDSLWALNSRVYSIDLKAPSSVDDEGSQFGNEVLNILDGFRQLSNGYRALDESIRTKGVPSVMAHLLDKPGLVDSFAAYSEGIVFLNDLVIVQELRDEEEGAEADREDGLMDLDRRIPYLLGYWLYNSILRFPGLILNEIAAASYLDIDVDDYMEESVMRCFQSAEYTGPFSKTRKYWWRPVLDDLLIEHGGRDEILRANEVDASDIRHAVSHVSKTSPAGYYDIFAERPVSREDSVGNLSWIPSGADLARVAREQYEEIAPILGL